MSLTRLPHVYQWRKSWLGIWTVTIKASTDNLGSEDYVVGWFVSEGEIKNRRAAETTWKTGTSGKQLLIATIGGKRSQSVAIDIKEFSAD